MRRILKMMIITVLIVVGILPISILGATVNDTARSKDDNQKIIEKVAYLTFDDGPTGEVTEKILDILKMEDVKATFFIVGKEVVQREEVLKRIYEEGHGIGLHTYSHNFKKVYTSPECFVEEMQKTEDKINEVIGEKLDIKVIRFPGGSSGRLDEAYLNLLHQNDYRIFDWHVSIEDGVNPNLSASKLFENAKKHKKDADSVIILAHCNSNNKTTCTALPDIIKYYKDQGYKFDVINNNTPEYHYKIKNKCK